MAALLLVTVMLLRATGQPESWLLPVVALVGLAVAGYLAHVETTASEAVCGVVGDCNTVQQSPYARIFGIPIGLIGVAGYVAILLVWFYGQVGSRRLADAALLLMALFGVVFSIYLTFLEPFVIGATCLWCLTSAALMALILWLAAPAGWRALADLAARPEERRRTPA
ncbi:MAG: vitamin K epoxide reductase [Chloroflexi bacterium]|nr:vitamin K epoxide reductase [Chloroflexota bacterium]